MCACSSVEDTLHYFFHCKNFKQQRIELINDIFRYCNPSLNLILYGDLTLSFETYLYVSVSGSITSVGEERANLSAVVYL